MASRALDIFNQQESQRDIACAALWLCNLLEATGDITRAQQLRNTAYTIYSRNHWDLREPDRECSLLEPKHSLGVSRHAWPILEPSSACPLAYER